MRLLKSRRTAFGKYYIVIPQLTDVVPLQFFFAGEHFFSESKSKVL